MTAGRPRKFSNAAEKQKAYRERKKAQEPHCMAKPGYIYILRWDGLYKIGCSENPEKRARKIQNKHGVYGEIVHIIPTNNMIETEAHLHTIFKEIRVDRDLLPETFSLSEPELELLTSFLFMPGPSKRKHRPYLDPQVRYTP